MHYKGIIFDLDGTLLDTIADLANSVNQMLTERGYPTHSIEVYKSFVGGGARNLIMKSLPAGVSADEQAVDEALLRYKEIYQQRFMEETKPYPGIISLLDSLNKLDLKLAVLSNKHDAATQVLTQSLLPPVFLTIAGERTGVKPKPDPEGVLQIAETMGLDSENIIYIGDSEVDVQTANNAGMLPLGVSWGFRDVSVLKEAGAELVISHPEDILSLDLF